MRSPRPSLPLCTTVRYTILDQTAAELIATRQEFNKFRVLDDQRFESDFDCMVKQLPARKSGDED